MHLTGLPVMGVTLKTLNETRKQLNALGSEKMRARW